MSPNPSSFDEFIRARREDNQRRRITRQEEFDAARAAFEADLRALDAEAAEVEAAERLWHQFGGEAHQPNTGPNGHEAPPPGAKRPGDESYKTQKEMVWEVVRRFGPGKGIMRHEIERLIQSEFNEEIPPPSISVSLKRLKVEERVRVKDLLWFPIEGAGPMS